MGGVSQTKNSGGFFDSFSTFVGNIGTAIGQGASAVGNFITQRESLRLQRAQAQAQLAAVQQQARLATGVQVQPTAASNAQRQQRIAGGLPSTIAGVPTMTLMLIGGAIMAYRVLK